MPTFVSTLFYMWMSENKEHTLNPKGKSVNTCDMWDIREMADEKNEKVTFAK